MFLNVSFWLTLFIIDLGNIHSNKKELLSEILSPSIVDNLNISLPRHKGHGVGEEGEVWAVLGRTSG